MAVTKKPVVSFDEKTHTYYKNGIPMNGSATKVVDYFNEDFDSEKALDKKGERDPRYLTNPLLRLVTKFEWDQSKEWGSLYHKMCEMYSNGELTRAMFDEAEYEVPPQVYNVIVWLKTIDRDEWEIITERLVYYERDGIMIGGSIDLVLRNKKDRNLFAVKDFKFTKTLDDKAYNKVMLPPFEHISASKQNKYFLQLNIYKVMLLEEFPDARFVDVELLHSAPEKENPFSKATIEPRLNIVPVRDMMKDAKVMLDVYIDHIKTGSA